MKLFSRKKKRKMHSADDRENLQMAKLREAAAAHNGSKTKDLADENSLQEKLFTQTEEETKKSKKEVKRLERDRKKLNYKNKTECMDYVSEQCDMIHMAERQLTETKVEYGAVTAYLTDIQRIDQIPMEDKDKVMEAARRIVSLSEERNRFQNREVKISEIMYKHLEKYEDIIPSEIKKMQQNEEYEHLIRQDLKNLESEKASLVYEGEELDQKKSYVRSISLIATILIAILFGLFGLFKAKYQIDIVIPILVTVMVGIIVVFILFVEINRTNEAVKLNERKLNKAIGLMNKVKIKFVNNRNNLDYTYQKFRVHASKELAYLWEQYVKAKDEEKRYQQNTELLEYYRTVLVDALDQYEIEDTEVWVYQPLALIDNKEMVEVRHRLNQRRQKLRDQIDYNNAIIKDSKAEIVKVVKQVPELEYPVEKMLLENKVSVEYETEEID